MKQPHVSSQEEGQADLKTGILDNFHGENPSIQARGHKEWAHPRQQLQELLTDAQGNFAVDLNILLLKVSYWSEEEFCHFVKHEAPL